jgi:adenosylhomocysteine nucleosidase
MTGRTNNGIVNTGTMHMYGPVAAGPNAVINVTTESRRPPSAGKDEAADVGIITVISEEARAVRRELNLKPDVKDGVSFDSGIVSMGGRTIAVAALQALSQGEDPVGSAFARMREYFSPKIVILAGIAGGIHSGVDLGDVVIAARVISYDLRKETAGRTLRRGQERQAPAEIGHAVNRFFADHGEPACFKGSGQGDTPQAFRVLGGPVGSGNAVIAHRDSEIVRYLLAFNDKTLAVDMESGGLSQAQHALPAGQRPVGWLVIRGISDHANEEKNDDYHRIAAARAAAVLREMLPYL